MSIHDLLLLRYRVDSVLPSLAKLIVPEVETEYPHTGSAWTVIQDSKLDCSDGEIMTAASEAASDRMGNHECDGNGDGQP